MAFNFPNDPSPGQDFTPAGGPTYTWDGLAWRTVTPVGGTARVTVADDPPIGADVNTLWYCSKDGTLAILYDDGDSQQWVTIAAGGTPQIATSSDPPENPLPGEIWWNPDTGLMMVWYNGAWVEVAQSEGGGGASISVSDDPPEAPGNNALWWSSKTGMLSLWYNDGNSSQWVVPTVPASPGVLSPNRLAEGMLVLTAAAISFEIPVPPNAKIGKMTLVSVPATVEGYPTLIFSRAGAWQNKQNYVNADITKSGSAALASAAGQPGDTIFLGNQSSQAVATVIEATFCFVGQPQVVAIQGCYSGAVGQSIGVRGGIATSIYVPDRIGLQVNSGLYQFAAGSCVQYEFWG